MLSANDAEFASDLTGVFADVSDWRTDPDLGSLMRLAAQKLARQLRQSVVMNADAIAAEVMLLVAKRDGLTDEAVAALKGQTLAG